ncbi:hypothetical protein M947_09010 [Sulfurimonas hongkongensis]|uniref:Glycerophosphoryl diester phosphodiesterase membrane domain-containing protein n=1 Tax=Sulfurimonas hongkongensis TaxID=1172190 RepID=T0JBF5_9BACT|nr:EI24 domain-containing protein [Sulfurimonas hongkongensis]EQB35411.1 hypothetical protein M947_09010 [Sulfurimonas hongkongensis]
MKTEKDIILLSIKDFLSLKMLKYSLAPFFITLILMYILFFIFAGMGVDSLAEMQVQSTQTTIQNGIPHTQSVTTMVEGNSVVEYLMSFAITSWLATFFIYAIGGFLTLYISIFIAIIVIGFLTPFVLRELQKRHYQDIKLIGYSNLLTDLFLVVKWAVIMILLFIALIPFYFIPIVNIVAFNLPLYYFFHKMLKFDISSNICTKQESKQIDYFLSNKLRLKTLSLYLISLVPFAIFFGAVLFVIYLGHTYFLEVKKLRSAESTL